jgi:hypothetical protein
MTTTPKPCGAGLICSIGGSAIGAGPTRKPRAASRSVERCRGIARMTAVAAVLLGSLALSASAGATTAPGSHFCRSLEWRVEECERGSRLRVETRASCDRIERGLEVLCGKIDTIQADASAAGPTLDLLSEDFEIVDIETLSPRFARAHVVIGPDALDKPEIMALVELAYRTGLTVAIVNATQEEADRFDTMLEGGLVASCLPLEGESEIALYALQQTPGQQPPTDSRYCLPSLVDVDENASLGVRRWLRERFASPELTQATSAGSGSVNLDDLAKKTHCSELISNLQGQIQQDLFISSLRSFDQQSDYYYVNNFVQYISNKSQYEFETNVSRPSAGTGFNDLLGTRLLFTEPGTTTEAVSQYTNSRSTTVSGGVGFGTSGFDVEASASVTVGTERTVSVPPVTIFNTPNLAGATPIWTFRPVTSVPGTLFDTLTSFLWIVDREVYPNGGEGIDNISSLFEARIRPKASQEEAFLRLHGQCEFPVPFPTWEVTAPQIASVDPKSVRRGGGSFLILGEQMYPSIVSNVLLGGNALPSANFVTLDDKEIRVVVPGGQKVGLTPVQVNTFFNGQVLPSNNDVQVDIRP